MKSLKGKILTAAAIVGLIVVVRASDLNQLVTFERLRESRNALTGWVSGRYFLSVVLYTGAYIAATALSLPLAAVLTLAGGFLFGYYAMIYINVGATAGAALAFLASRYLFGGWVQQRYGTRLARFNGEIEANGKNHLLTLRLIPVIPFWLINIGAGLTKIPLSSFVWTTSVGIIPGSFVYVYFGTQLESIQTMSDLFSYKILSALVLMAVLFNIPLIYGKLKGGNLQNEHKKQKDDGSDPGDHSHDGDRMLVRQNGGCDNER